MHFIFNFIYTQFTGSSVSVSFIIPSLFNIASLCDNVIFLIKQRLLDIAKQEFDAVLSVSSKCHFDQYIVTNVCLQEYLCKPILKTYLPRLHNSLVLVTLNSCNIL
jgi:hypothetical protein